MTVYPITTKEEAVLLCIWRLCRRSGVYAKRKELVTYFKWKHWTTMEFVKNLKKMGLVSTLQKREAGRFKPTPKAIAFIHKFKMGGRK